MTQETKETKEIKIEGTDITTLTLFGQESVKRLTSSDFELNTDHPITLKIKDCVIVLFYSENTESKKLAQIWSLAARQVAGPIFAACNLLMEKDVAKAFNSLNLTNGSLRNYSLKGIPYIISYQNSWPVGFYNGERAVQSIIDYVLTLACRSDYFEPIQLPASMQAENNYEMTGWKEYKPVRTDSLEYKVSSPIRGYESQWPLRIVPPPTSSPTTSPTTSSTTSSTTSTSPTTTASAQQVLGTFGPGTKTETAVSPQGQQ